MLIFREVNQSIWVVEYRVEVPKKGNSASMKYLTPELASKDCFSRQLYRRKNSMFHCFVNSRAELMIWIQ